MDNRRSWALSILTLACLAACGSSIGDACTTDQDCGGRSCSTASTFPGGYCTERCVVGDSGSCPTGSTCVDHHGGASCLRICADDTECRSGYVCLTYRSDGAFCLIPSDG